MNIELAGLLDPALALAEEAGKKIMEVYASDFGVELKDDSSPLTAADLASHRCLEAGLKALAPQFPLLSEESAALPFAARADWETYWLVDPLDGTKEFVKRNGEFTVNIALVHRHRPVLGVVLAPALDLCYFAAAGLGAFKRQGGGPAGRIAARPQAPARPAVVGSRSHGAPDMDAYLARLGGHELKPVGSSLKFCLVAEGAADVYPRLGPTSEWDTAAAQCVAEEAGAAVVDLRGEALRYNARPSLLNPYFLVFADRSRDWLGCAAGIEG